MEQHAQQTTNFLIVDGTIGVIELKMFLEASTLEEIKKNSDKVFMVTILHAINPNFGNIRDQIITSQEASTMESLTTQLLCSGC